MGPGGTMNDRAKKASRQKLVMLGGVSVVGLAVGIRMLSSGPKAAPAATVVPPAVPAMVGSAAPLSQPAKPALMIAWPTDITRDPFQSDLVFPPAAPPPAPLPVEPKVDVPAVVTPVAPPVDLGALVAEKIQLKGTVLGDRPIAMMNGRVYRVGEVLEGFKIVEIAKNQITVERDATRFVVKVN